MSPRSSLAVDAADVRRRLLRCSVPAVTADRVVGRARDRGLSSGAMWRWMDAYDADGLVVAVDAGLTEDVLLRHLRGGTSPDWTSLELFARLANDALPGGIPLEEIIDLDAVPQLEDLDLAGELDRWGTPLDDDRLGGSGARPHELRWSQPDGGWPNPA